MSILNAMTIKDSLSHQIDQLDRSLESLQVKIDEAEQELRSGLQRRRRENALEKQRILQDAWRDAFHRYCEADD